ncbi:L-asparaginase [Boletus reticuloceps]|uniref:L-asparaginase n=1 Tax=Boletus reticuloceps TaxID=495285 RepID=A0A8I2YTI5_9AGAM|nr:L-asparaginase [Boletus reticuloceps]
MLSKPTTRRGISVILLTRTQNPSHLIRTLYLAPSLAPHPVLSGATAEIIGAEHLGIQTVDPSYFWTEARLEDQQVGRVRGQYLWQWFLGQGMATPGGFLQADLGRKPSQCGVGSLAQSDILTCVRFFSNCEYYIRRNAASTTAHRMRYLDESVEEAAQHAVNNLFRDGGLGRIIAVDRQGNVALPLNRDGMYRGLIRADDELS